MADKFNKLNETFDIEPDNSETSKIEKIEQISSTVEDIKKDYEYTRGNLYSCLLYTSPSPRDGLLSRMPSSA